MAMADMYCWCSMESLPAASSFKVTPSILMATKYTLCLVQDRAPPLATMAALLVTNLSFTPLLKTCEDTMSMSRTPTLESVLAYLHRLA